ncbi:undecaprenyl-diphosphate phosphatase [Sneathiella sp. HT1-7]|uniref:undecaprenyl-diphosphate phosphatase n=1 Tax=Sneathiella sp. HT1-7 TaxID=2887192 RepID=UPI001D133D30|nr:undecaprenyl-diphosphate phosphatase [Sneathiella sp. HT1-7]MCC3306620.1 undecaprenyl-diphosphate phosphatase [Sneathiella sp. HT1-7]
MPFFHILVLAAIQGITEFLPISSSGHLLVIPTITGWADQGQTIDIAVHVGTLVAVVAYFRKDVQEIVLAFLRPTDSSRVEGRRLGWHILIASIPVVIAGGAMYYFIQGELRSILLVAGTTIIFGLFLGWADKNFPVTKKIGTISVLDSFVIGLFQVLSLLPGTSRSGITMSAARMRGLSRSDGAHFSMLLSIPTILGAGTLAAYHLIKMGDTDVGLDAVLAGVISCLVAFLVISLLMRWIEKIGFTPFIIYRLILGVLLLALYFAT